MEKLALKMFKGIYRITVTTHLNIAINIIVSNTINTINSEIQDGANTHTQDQVI